MTLSRPPAGTARSTNSDTGVPTAPTGTGASSLTLRNTGLLLASSSGASLTGLTKRLAVSVAAEKAVAPPSLLVEASDPFDPLVWSQARNVITSKMGPSTLELGRK